MDFGEVVCQVGTRKDVVPVLSVCEVVVAQVRAGDDDLVVDAVQLHVLQPPALIEAFGDNLLPEPTEVRRVVHTNVNAVCAKLGHERNEKGGA